MILGNKCDMNDRRQVSKERGEQVSATADCKNKSLWIKLPKLKEKELLVVVI